MRLPKILVLILGGWTQVSERSNCELLSELRIVCVCGRELFATERKKTIFENFVIKMRDDTVWPSLLGSAFLYR